MDNPNYEQDPPSVGTLQEDQSISNQPATLNQTNNGILVNQTITTQLVTTNPLPKDWRFNLFDCLDDVTLCVRSFFLPCMVVDEIAAHYGIGNNGEVCFWQALGCNFIPGLREKVREEFNIPGEMVSDHIHGNACACCALIQMRREIEAAKFMNYNQVNVPVIDRT